MVNAPLVSQSQCLVLFARAPTPGQVKKRLIPDLNSGPACELYRAFVDDILDRFRGSREFCVRMAVAGDEPLRLPASWKRVPLFVQQGNALGKRLAHAFRVLFADGFERVVIIGTDAPTLSADFVREAFESLQRKDVVIGPAVDGGYYLIGLHSHVRRDDDASVRPPLRKGWTSLFQDIEWGGAQVLAQTLNVVRQLGLSLHLLPPWYDVDNHASLRFLACHLEALDLSGMAVPPNTFSKVRTLLGGPSPAARAETHAANGS